MSPENRQFERLAISEEAIAIDENGHRLGRVSHAGGGGMTINLSSEISRSLVPGSRLRVTVEEPAGIRHTVSVEVRYCVGNNLGVEFVSAG